VCFVSLLPPLPPGSGQVIDQGARLVDIALEKGTAFEGDGWK
jgi:2,3-bisphosphoglycerate-independent phosphoglycerate mutase